MVASDPLTELKSFEGRLISFMWSVVATITQGIVFSAEGYFVVTVDAEFVVRTLNRLMLNFKDFEKM